MASTRKPSDTDRFAHLAEKVQDHSTVLQAMQVDMHHLVKNVDRLVIVAEKQAELSGELNRHSDSIQRAFDQQREHRDELSSAIRELSNTLKSDREKSEKISDTVKGYRASLKAIMMVGGGITALLVILATMFANSMAHEHQLANAAIDKVVTDLDRRKLASDVKMDALAQQLQELRLNMQISGTRAPRSNNSSPTGPLE